jgi:8-oxo-dGTP pyrophosphatase MutT (NUDIX family)
MDYILRSVLYDLAQIDHADMATVAKAYIRIDNEPTRLVQSAHATDHFCVFFLPYHAPSNSIYLVHHKKAEDWIPPGGHIEMGEHPSDTVVREFQEELKVEIGQKSIELFDISRKKIADKGQSCDVHWDIWHLVHTPKHDFVWDRREFYSSGWYEIGEGLEKITKNEEYRNIIGKLNSAVDQRRNNRKLH